MSQSSREGTFPEHLKSLCHLQMAEVDSLSPPQLKPCAGLVLVLHSMRISHTVPAPREFLAAHPTACCPLCSRCREREGAGQRREQTFLRVCGSCEQQPPPAAAPGPTSALRLSRLRRSAKTHKDDENENKEPTRSVLGQRRQRCLRESTHANWKWQKGPRAHASQNP